MDTSRRLSPNLIACTPRHLRRAVPLHTQHSRYGFRSLLLRLLPPVQPSCADTRLDPRTQMRLLFLRARGMFPAPLHRCSTLVNPPLVDDLVDSFDSMRLHLSLSPSARVTSPAVPAPSATTKTSPAPRTHPTDAHARYSPFPLTAVTRHGPGTPSTRTDSPCGGSRFSAPAGAIPRRTPREPPQNPHVDGPRRIHRRRTTSADAFLHFPGLFAGRITVRGGT